MMLDKYVCCYYRNLKISKFILKLHRIFVLHHVQRAFFLEELEEVEGLSILGKVHRNIL